MGVLWYLFRQYPDYNLIPKLRPSKGNKALDIAIDCEVTDLEYRDGWYYLLGTFTALVVMERIQLITSLLSF